MRVLVANKFWYRRGGLEHVMFDEIEWLERAGHEIAHFSTSHPGNVPSRWSEYFVPYMELGRDTRLRPPEKALASARLFYNAEAARRFAALLRRFRPDVIHFHGIHRQLSPSIMRVARRFNVPAVQTFHDYQAVCPADVLLLEGRETCSPPRCSRVNTAPCVWHRCVQRSLPASMLSAVEFVWRIDVLRYCSWLDLVVSPSRHLAKTLQASGWHEAFVRVVPNATAADTTSATHVGDYFLFAGRLSPEKGAGALVEAAGSSNSRLVVAGDGPLRAQLEATAAARHLAVEFVGHVGPRQVGELIRECRAVVVPSLGLENAPLIVLEAMAAAKPVIASRVGGIPEQVREDVEGLLLDPGDVPSLATAMRRVADDPLLALRLGQAGRERVADAFAPKTHVMGLMAAYEQAIDHRRAETDPLPPRRALAIPGFRWRGRSRRSAV
jgi:glycosyltransferase involved in cell wall biosynthesis